MKDEFWSIRKMRAEQKLSQTRNTYKQSETFQLKAKVNDEQNARSSSLLSTFYQRLQLFLEE